MNGRAGLGFQFRQRHQERVERWVFCHDQICARPSTNRHGVAVKFQLSPLRINHDTIDIRSIWQKVSAKQFTFIVRQLSGLYFQRDNWACGGNPSAEQVHLIYGELNFHW